MSFSLGLWLFTCSPPTIACFSLFSAGAKPVVSRLIQYPYLNLKSDTKSGDFI